MELTTRAGVISVSMSAASVGEGCWGLRLAIECVRDDHRSQSEAVKDDYTTPVDRHHGSGAREECPARRIFG